jgi:8-hydroxy-5-deazaflavin:NADPH oxidoreductase
MIVGMLGAGHMAQTLARGWLPSGHQVWLANSRGPESLAELIADLGDGAAAVEPAELVDADVVVLATQWTQLPAALARVGSLAGKIVVDATNNRVGPGPEGVVDLGGRTSSEVVAELVPGARLVKAFNHLPIPSLGTLRERPEPVALFVAGDDPAAKAVVGTLAYELGGVPVDTGSLAEGGRLHGAGSSPLLGHGHPLTPTEAEAILASAPPAAESGAPSERPGG